MGHRHLITGKIVKGNQLGRTIGAPTANMEIPPGIIVPRHGVYAAVVSIDGRDYKSVTNVGVRPTVSGDGSVTVESHILNFRGDIYGKTCRTEFCAFIRPEKKFESIDALKMQIQKDILSADEIIKL